MENLILESALLAHRNFN